MFWPRYRWGLNMILMEHDDGFQL
ncbi:DUF3103 domain-containing protein [Vibrio chagasii]|nr:DUF3103 domain-containing protein [Vibrio chagasii]